MMFHSRFDLHDIYQDPRFAFLFIWVWHMLFNALCVFLLNFSVTWLHFLAAQLFGVYFFDDRFFIIMCNSYSRLGLHTKLELVLILDKEMLFLFGALLCVIYVCANAELLFISLIFIS